jgi:hypothetical protein
MALLSASGCIPDRYRSRARTTVLFSTIETKLLLIDTRAFITLAPPGCGNLLWFQVSRKRPGEEKSVDVEKPESSWGTTGEQLFPNETVFARKRASRPP